MITDVWRTIGSQVRYLSHDTFDLAPSGPGVYAWHYPLRLSTLDLDQFVNEINTALSYDASTRGCARSEISIPFNWSSLTGEISLDPKELVISSELRDVWDRLTTAPSRLRAFQENLLRCTILMPPLYVGKTSNLLRRLREHLDGRDGCNDFHNRFCDYARESNLGIQAVQELLFVCASTDDSEESKDDARVANLTEEILKVLAKPAYSLK